MVAHLALLLELARIVVRAVERRRQAPPSGWTEGEGEACAPSDETGRVVGWPPMASCRTW